jgi:hypothetical protein
LSFMMRDSKIGAVREWTHPNIKCTQRVEAR